MVFDRNAIATQLYQGNATPAYQIFREGSDAFIADLKDPYPYDVEKAKSLMASAGFADGFDLTIPTMSGQNHELLLPYITQQLALINIRVTEKKLSGPTAITDLLSGEYPVPVWELGNYGESLQDISDYLLPEGIWNVEHQEDAKIAGLWEKVLICHFTEDKVEGWRRKSTSTSSIRHGSCRWPTPTGSTPTPPGLRSSRPPISPAFTRCCATSSSRHLKRNGVPRWCSSCSRTCSAVSLCCYWSLSQRSA